MPARLPGLMGLDGKRERDFMTFTLTLEVNDKLLRSAARPQSSEHFRLSAVNEGLIKLTKPEVVSLA